MTPLAHVAQMATDGLLVSVLAPLLLLLLRALGVEPPTLPAPVAAPAFVLLHAAVTLLPALTGIAPILLLAGGVLFWAPVLGHRRLSPAGRIVYLFATMPALDLPGVWLVARGDGPGGIAMVVGMLPIGLTALALAVGWARAEEAAACGEQGSRTGAAGTPATASGEGVGRAHS
ncbi:cytochrome c oxidase assembly protein [Pseudonocardia kujensis]|uniref:cytochrome c oxidase assembly protein n=1 Tax=Pseudonocardia kujensis TaxID=1128675 RepID=UPI001E492702|nr:cytochrome c oxidase assembly protein [Pseudonocardia kujensis]MCE0767113.1 cytochrome c oxidase assembly protein [Pseudonocardia kujensis]